MSAVSSRVRKFSHKYGFEIPSSISHAKKLDENNGNTFWTDGIRKEMMNVGIAFVLLEQLEQAPPGWTKASGHIIFDINMDFTRKARWVKDGNKKPDPTTRPPVAL